MDASRFDAWTRRRFNLVAGGALAATLGLGEAARVAAKKKKRCKKLGKACKPKKKNCCGNLACKTISFEEDPQTRCCRKIDKPCTDSLDCCANLCCDTEAGVCTDFCAI
jgi:hypothetical protein